MLKSPEGSRTEPRIAVVAPNLPLDRTFDYIIPEPLRGRVQPGSRVRVPFGNRKSVLGYCVGLKDEPDVPEAKLKPLKKCLDKQPLFTPELQELARWISDYYRCSLGEALHAVLPAAVRKGRRRRKLQFAVLEMTPDEAEEKADEIFDRSPSQSKILRALAAADGEAPLVNILKGTSTSRSSSGALERRGLIRIEKRIVEPDDPLSPVRAERRPPHRLTAEQQQAFAQIKNWIERETFHVVLLHGITSSGKTEVYMHAIAEVVERGRQAIVLVPEISLTPQTVRHFSSRFDRLAVLHSHLTEADRRRQWQTIRRGEADVVIGARSAVFAPVPDLGLLVIDEEHENTFKQDNVPRYHARDVGIVRAGQSNALVILGTATPSLETYYNARTGKYTALRLTRRIGEHPLPPVEIVDMREEWAGKGRLRTISRRLEACVRNTLEKGRQALLFINRRGYSPFVHCTRCGFVLKCGRCDITLNYHRKINVAECHYCGYQQRPPDACPECGLEPMRYGGTGTEKVHDAVEKLFPDSTSIRMDSDTTRARRSHEQKLDAFRKGEADILVGTQMVAKGLDFPNVTTVGVVNADVALHLPDFRSRERTFQLLAQVAGRTGRGPAGGRVIVQTFMPAEPSIQAAAKHDYEEFAQNELPHRRRFRYPPFGRLIRIICRGRKLERIEDFTRELGKALRKLCSEATESLQVLGPNPAPVSQIRGRHRRHLLIKCPNSRSVRELLDEAQPLLKGPSGIKVLVDVDPVSML